MDARAADAPAACLSCELVAGRRSSPGGVIVEDDYFHVHQDVGVALPGFVIVASRRHYRGWDAMSAQEAASFAVLVPQVRRAQREALGVVEAYYFLQEDTRHHFHLWMLPRLPWMDAFGPAPASLPQVLRHAHERMNTPDHWHAAADAAQRLRLALQAHATNPGALPA